MANGSLEKLFKDPMKGEWIIKAIPEVAIGKVNINLHQGYRLPAKDPTEKSKGEK